MQSLAVQLGITLVAALAALPFSAHWAIAVLLGGMIAIAGNLLAVVLVFRRYRAAEAGALATRMIGAEFARLLVVAAGFALVFATLKDVAVFVLFGAFLIVHLLPVWWLHRVSDQAMKR